MPKIAFTGGRLLDGTGALPVDNALLLVEDKKIAYAGPAQSVGGDYQKIDISGKTIMPGIVDTHLHFSGNLTDNDSDWVLENVIQKTVVAVQQARECLDSGLTTVGEISRSGIHIRNMIEAGVMAGPRVIATGLGFCRTAGHGDSHRLPGWYNDESHPWAERVDSPWDLRKAVRRRLREGPDAVKIWATGGGIWKMYRKLDPHYTMDEIEAVVYECKMVDLPVWAHAEGYEGALACAKAGVHLIIHGQTLNDECLDIMAGKGIYFCPTIQFLQEWFKSYSPPYDPAVHDQYLGETVAEKELQRIYANLRKADAKGIGLTIGSDSFCSSLTPYGTTAVNEIYAFVERAGLTPMTALMAATKIGADMLKVGAEKELCLTGNGRPELYSGRYIIPECSKMRSEFTLFLHLRRRGALSVAPHIYACMFDALRIGNASWNTNGALRPVINKYLPALFCAAF